MKAAVFHDVRDIRLEEMPDPTPGPADVIVEVSACGICGSDLEYYYGRSPVGTPDGKGPLVLGHEFSGVVVAMGDEATGVAVGDRVAVNPIQSSASDDLSRSGNPHYDLHEVLGVTTHGGFARYVRARAEHAYRLPDSMSDEQGAFVEMLAASVNAVEKANITLGDLCVIYGPGPVGLSMVQVAYRSGARVAMVGTRDYRLELAKEMGAEFVFNVGDKGSKYYTDDLAGSIREANCGALAERAILATSVVEACQQALDITGNGSTIVYMGLAGPDDVVKLPMLGTLVAGEEHRLLLALPEPVAEDDPPPARRRRRHLEDHHAHGAARRHQRRDRARLRSRGRRHQVRGASGRVSMGRLEGRVALVTGAAHERGIGRGIATALAQEGADVAINDVGYEDAGEQLAEELRALGRRAIFVRADVSDRAQVDALVERVEQELGPLWIAALQRGRGRLGAVDGDHAAELGPHRRRQPDRRLQRRPGRGAAHGRPRQRAGASCSRRPCTPRCASR